MCAFHVGDERTTTWTSIAASQGTHWQRAGIRTWAMTQIQTPWCGMQASQRSITLVPNALSLCLTWWLTRGVSCCSQQHGGCLNFLIIILLACLSSLEYNVWQLSAVNLFSYWEQEFFFHTDNFTLCHFFWTQKERPKTFAKCRGCTWRMHKLCAGMFSQLPYWRLVVLMDTKLLPFHDKGYYFKLQFVKKKLRKTPVAKKVTIFPQKSIT